MGLSWCMTTGFNTPVTYFYPIYFAVFLIHRALRDDDACEKKYGHDWPAYKAKVPYLFFPGII
jgi:delta14-sterol reductase